MDKKELAEAKKEMKAAEKAKDEKKAEQLLVRIHELEKPAEDSHEIQILMAEIAAIDAEDQRLAEANLEIGPSAASKEPAPEAPYLDEEILGNKPPRPTEEMLEDSRKGYPEEPASDTEAIQGDADIEWAVGKAAEVRRQKLLDEETLLRQMLANVQRNKHGAEPTPAKAAAGEGEDIDISAFLEGEPIPESHDAESVESSRAYKQAAAEYKAIADERERAAFVSRIAKKLEGRSKMNPKDRQALEHFWEQAMNGEFDGQKAQEVFGARIEKSRKDQEALAGRLAKVMEVSASRQAQIGEKLVSKISQLFQSGQLDGIGFTWEQFVSASNEVEKKKGFGRLAIWSKETSDLGRKWEAIKKAAEKLKIDLTKMGTPRKRE